MYSRIAGIGSYLPERVLTNAELETMVDTTDEWIRSRTGIERRHIANDDQTTTDLAEQAARRAMENAGVTPADIDFIVVGTTTPDVVFPNVGCLLQQRFDIHGCPAFSVETACSGFIYALSIADRYVVSGGAKCALVIGAETLSRMTDWNDRATCVIFGDGAGAVILQPADEPGIISCHLGADGRYHDLLYNPYGTSKQRKPGDTEGPYIQMRGNEVFKVAVKTLENLVDQTLAENHLDKHEIDWLVPHQANTRIIQATAKRLDMPMDKVVMTVREHGNTSAASVPLALDTAVRDGRIQRGDLLLLETFGGGFTWGSSLIRF
ncbi:MAG: beta-ketoacyl-ACP synthase III [Gammaproteobacteria bacterium]|nr:beta-ketoacyl-ACP synthase III [Gammaproteobacteria bacterium]